MTQLLKDDDDAFKEGLGVPNLLAEAKDIQIGLMRFAASTLGVFFISLVLSVVLMAKFINF